MLIAENVQVKMDQRTLLDITLQFKTGSLNAILGPNGSGKSTLLKALTGIWPSTGSVIWNGQQIHKLKRKELSRIISLVPQSPEVHFDFTVLEMILMGRYSLMNPLSEEGLRNTLELVDITHLKDRSILTLSHGERKRVYIARALMTESPILLFDEPEAGLDIYHRQEIWKLLRRLADQGKTILVTNHDLEATRKYCDRAILLNHGKCVAEGRAEEVLTTSLIDLIFSPQHRLPKVYC